MWRRGALGIPLSSTGTLPAGIRNLMKLIRLEIDNTELSGAVSTTLPLFPERSRRVVVCATAGPSLPFAHVV
jgi:hypothetical protein